ncbi:MAG: divalent metal cation transporter [Enhydrobacter sp.]|nr:MAG: divalent metal cation transporter [Enhydrobacter sp.]
MSWLGGSGKRIGPGVITGAADDDPSGIATYSQAGAQAGFGLLWTIVLTLPMMVAVQSVSARIGRVTGQGLAANFVKLFPRFIVLGLVALLLVANTINIGADLAAMGAATELALGGPSRLYTVGFALVSLAAIVFIPYHHYVGVLKWLTFSLFAYVGVVFAIDIDWRAVAAGALVPRLAFDAPTVTLIVAVFGTTISPYLFFWQASEEVEEEEADADSGPLLERPEQAVRELRRIGWDTWLGMGFSNLIAFFIMLTTALTLNASGHTDIATSAEAAAALRPIAGEFAFLLFALGIVGTGLLAVPVLAGSAAYAVGEALGSRTGLERRPGEARLFYAVIGAAILIGLGIDFAPISAFQALLWSAVLNGVITVPIMAAMLLVASRRAVMGDFVATPLQRLGGWTTVAMMGLATIAMFALL